MGEATAALEKLREEPHKSTGHAFVAFESEEDKVRLLNLLAPPVGFELAINCVRRTTERTSGRRSAAAPEPLLPSAAPEGKAKATEAPEPADVYWDNMSANVADKKRRRLYTFGVTFLLVALSAGVGITFKTNARDLTQRNKDSALFRFVITATSTATISLTNLILSLVIPPLTRRERHVTWRDYQRSCFVKLAIGYLVNACILPLVVAYLPIGVTQAQFH